jgi:putative copper export protein
MFPTVVLWIHLIATITWIGGILFQLLVLGPVLKGMSPASQGLDIQNRVGLRFRTVRWLSLVTLVVTGLLNLLYEGGSARLESDWGGILMVKLLFVVIVIGLNFVYDLTLAPGRAKTSSQSSVLSEFWLAQGIVMLSLFIVLIAVYLARF